MLRNVYRIVGGDRLNLSIRGQGARVQYLILILVIVSLIGSWMAYVKVTGTESEGAEPDNVLVGGEGWTDLSGEVNWEELPEQKMVVGLYVGDMEGMADSEAAHVFKDYVERVTDGRFTVELHFGGELGGQTELIEMVSNGTIEGCQVTASTLSKWDKNWSLVQTPYMFSYLEVGDMVWNIDKGFGKRMNQALIDKLGVRFTYLSTIGFRNWTSNKKLDSVEDFEGLIFRTMPTEGMLSLTKELGASPEPMDIGETYSAIKTGVINGQENPPWVVDLLHFYEVNSWLTLDRHAYSAGGIIVNNDYYTDLHPLYQWVVKAAATKAEKMFKDTSTANADASLRKLKEEELMNIYEPPEQVRMEFKKAAMVPTCRHLRNDVVDPKVFDDMIEATLEAQVDLGVEPNLESAKANLPNEILEMAGIE